MDSIHDQGTKERQNQERQPDRHPLVQIASPTALPLDLPFLRALRVLVVNEPHRTSPAPMNTPIIDIAARADWLEQIGRIRVAAWKTETGATPDMDCWIDPIDRDPNSRLYAIFDGDRIVASARLTIHASLAEAPDAPVYTGVLSESPAAPIAVLSRLVVHPDHRRLGYGTALDRHRLETARTLGCRTIVGSSSAPRRIAQLEALGFHVAGRQNHNPHAAFSGRGLQSVLLLALTPD
jgi:GNAT superfamily N-acetyltransferase